MQHIVLEGETLGERHRYYNQLVEKTVTGIDKIGPVDFNDNDIDNLFKIDVASKRRDVEYILEVLKCDDMLYVSRALKQSTWLITDQQHAHIINPSYLHRNLIPHMNTQAINKLTLHIRNNLKDKRRIKAFYCYHLKNNSKTALKWLQECPVHFILRAVKKHGRDIPVPILKRLCRKSPHALSIYLDRYQSDRKEVLSAVTFLAKNNTDVYLDVIQSTSLYYLNSFGATATGYFLKKCPDRIINNFEHYAAHIHLPTFVKYIKKNGVKDFLLKEASKGEREWFNFGTLKDFLKEIPRDETFDLLKILFRIDSEEMSISDLFYAIKKKEKIVPADVYRWYEFAPYKIARYELQKLIYAESCPEERQSMLSVLLACAGHDPEHIRATLQYYHDRHINEPYKFKILFINYFLDKTSPHIFDYDTWNLLNDLFHSMEVYIESDNEVTNCIDAIIIYRVVHDEVVPEIIEAKFLYDPLKYYQSKLNKEEKEKIFIYLYNWLTHRSFNKEITSETELKENVDYLESTWALIKDWKQEQKYNQIIIDKINQLLHVKKTISSTVNLSQLYNMMGRWRRVLFPVSLSLCTSEKTCLNALKHQPQLLAHHSAELQALRAVNTVPRRLLTKLRLYWPHTIAKEWKDDYFACIKESSRYNALIQGLYILVPSEKLTDFIKTHAPDKNRSECKKVDEVELSLRKHIAMNMHLARPTLSVDIVLGYAKDRCLNYTQPSLNIICGNQNSAIFEEHVQKLLKAPVSLQKHGIRLAFRKMKAHQLKTLFCQVWESTKNVTIREMIFTTTFQLLCKEKKKDLIKELWKVLSNFIDQLTPDENINIYKPLAEITNVPSCVRPDFYVKSYKFLKTLPEKTGSGFLIHLLLYYATDIIDVLDPDFVLNVLLESPCDTFFRRDYSHMEMLAVYILCSKNEESHAERCEQLLDPILNGCSVKWSTQSHFCMEDFLRHICRQMPKIVFNRNMVLPVLAFTKIHEFLEKIMTIEENYTRLTSWKLTVAFTKVLDELCKANQTSYSWHEILLKSVPYFGDICKKQLQEDMDKYFPSIYLIFGDALKRFCQMFEIDDMCMMELTETMLDDNITQTYLLGLQMLPRSIWEDENKRKQRDIRRKIYSHESAEVKMHYLLSFGELT